MAKLFHDVLLRFVITVCCAIPLLSGCEKKGAEVPMPPAEETIPAIETSFPLSAWTYTLTSLDLGEWTPVDQNNGLSADWMPVAKETAGDREYGIYRADGILLTGELEGGRVFMSDAPGTQDDTRYAVLTKDRGESWGIFDVWEGKLVSPYGDWESCERAWTELEDEGGPIPRQDEATALWGYTDKAGRWVIAPAYEEAGRFEDGHAKVCLSPEYPDTKCAVIDSAGEPCLLGGYLRYQGGGLYYFEQNDGRKGLVTLDGAETLVEREDLWVMGDRTFCAQGGILPFYAGQYEGGRYYDYRMAPVSETFDWVGPLNEALEGFVQHNGVVCRIAFSPV